MKKIQNTITAFLIALSLLATPLAFMTPGVSAAPCANAKDCITDGANIPTGTGTTPLSQQIKTVVNILLFVLGAIAVIMIVIGGIRYALSGGDSSAITAAKNTILYAVIGLVVAILAYAIVDFVIGAIA